MFHREWLRLSLLSLSFLFSSLIQAGDSPKNADSLIHESGGKWTGQLPISIEAGKPVDMPKGPEITPQYNQPSDSKSGGSSGWGILGFFINLGKKSAKDQHAEDVQRNIDRALSKSASGIPLTSEDYAALGTADLSKVRAYPREAQQDAARAAIAKHFDAKAAAEKAATAAKAAAATTTPTTTTPLTTTPIPTNASPSSNFIAPHIGKGSKTCLPQMTGYGMPGVVQPTAIIPTSDTPKLPSVPSGDKPNFPSIGSGNPPTIGAVMPPVPMKGPNEPSGGNMATGIGALAGAGTLAQVATAGGAATTTGAGTVITAGAACTVLTTVAIGAAAVSGLAFGTLAILDYNYPTERNVFFKGRYQEKLRREAIAKKNDSNGNQQNPKGPVNAGSPAIAAQNAEKVRKVNDLQRTEVMNEIKKNYRYDKQTKLYKLKDNGTPIKCTRTGKDVINVKWDHSHSDIEALNGKFKHMGSLDPVTFEMYKGPEINRIEL